LNHAALVLTLLEHVKGKYAILCDSSKTAWGSITAPFRLRRLLGQRFFLLHLVRDPRAVSWSAMRLPLIKTRRKHKPTPIEQALSRPIPRCVRTAAGWWVANLTCELFARLYPGQYLRLSYEDLASSPRETLRALFQAVSPICPSGLRNPRRAATGTRSTATECAVSDCDLPTCGLTVVGNPKWRPATGGWPAPSPGRCGCDTAIDAKGPERSMLSATLKTSGATPSELGGQPARCWANKSAIQLKESIHENAVNRGGRCCRSAARHIHYFRIGAGNLSAGVEERQ
jgi:hypothetical protein